MCCMWWWMMLTLQSSVFPSPSHTLRLRVLLLSKLIMGAAPCSTRQPEASRHPVGKAGVELLQQPKPRAREATSPGERKPPLPHPLQLAGKGSELNNIQNTLHSLLSFITTRISRVKWYFPLLLFCCSPIFLHLFFNYSVHVSQRPYSACATPASTQERKEALLSKRYDWSYERSHSPSPL